jgi:hypothetical protein
MCGTMLSTRTVKRTRKRHRCFGCSRVIPQGTMAEYSVSADGHELSASYMCLDCAEFQLTKEGRNAADDDGCIWPGSFREAEAPYVQFPILEPVTP